MSTIRTHVFLSFANADVEIVRRLAARLRAEGLAVWTGEELVPGTMDWEAAVRTAIEASVAVVLVASPASARSVSVRGELGVADARRLPVFAAWALGETWADSVPLALASSQYVDCRGDAFDAGASRLARVLRPIAEGAIPDHFANRRGDPFPSSCLSVALPPPAEGHGAPGEQAAVLKIGAYASLEAVLDQLYTHYLRAHYDPLTYGTSWVLTEERADGFGLVLAPWAWLTGTRIDRRWVRGRSPLDCSLLPGTRWQVSTPPGDSHGVAVTDARVLDALRATAKSDLAWRQNGYLAFAPVSDLDPARFDCTVICHGRPSFWRDEEVQRHTALAQVKPVPDAEIQWYLRPAPTSVLNSG